jgi:MYXO-CTERM domain-containing protein
VEADVNIEDGNQQFGFTGGSGNPAEDRGAYIRNNGSSMVLANMNEGNQDAGTGAYARIRIDVDLNTNATTLSITGLEGQGNATVSGTWDGGAGAGVTGLYLSADIRNLAASGIAVDNIVVGVPEPASGMLAAAGLLGLALCWSRRRRR